MAARNQPKPKAKSVNTATKTQMIANSLQALRGQRFQAELTMNLNGHTKDDIHPERGKPYKEVFKEFDDADERIQAKYPRLMPGVAKILKENEES